MPLDPSETSEEAKEVEEGGRGTMLQKEKLGMPPWQLDGAS
jgi:hypothetical protein